MGEFDTDFHPFSNGRRPSLKPTSSPRLIAISAGLALIVLCCDQLFKYNITRHYQPNDIIVGFQSFSLRFVTNTGGVCGYAQGANTILTAVGLLTTIIILGVILYWMPQHLPHSAAFGFLLAGAAGNLIDRLRFGYVVDYITLDLLKWPSFNIADASILAGIGLVALLAVQEMWQERKQSTGALAQPLDRNTIIFFVAAGLVFVLAYIVCIFRPFG